MCLPSLATSSVVTAIVLLDALERSIDPMNVDRRPRRGASNPRRRLHPTGWHQLGADEGSVVKGKRAIPSPGVPD